MKIIRENMGFKQYIEMRCVHCGCAVYYPGKSIQKAKKYWRDIGGIFRGGMSFCGWECKMWFEPTLNRKIKDGWFHRPILPETFD